MSDCDNRKFRYNKLKVITCFVISEIYGERQEEEEGEKDRDRERQEEEEDSVPESYGDLLTTTK